LLAQQLQAHQDHLHPSSQTLGGPPLQAQVQVQGTAPTALHCLLLSFWLKEL
jgi:hypothetical protein